MEILKNIFAPATSPEVNFMIKGLFSYSFFGHEVWITTSHVCIIIVLMIILGFSIAARARMKRATEVPDGFQNVVELIVEKIDGMVEGVMGKNAKFFANYIGTIFVFILISNFSGLLGLRPPTADYGVTFPLGVITFSRLCDDFRACDHDFLYNYVPEIQASACEGRLEGTL